MSYPPHTAPRLRSRLADTLSKRAAAIAAGVLLVVLTFSVYLPAWHAGFIWDDAEYVTDNPTLRTLDGLLRIWLEPGSLPQYYPLTLTTFWVEYHLWGLQPVGYHLVNVLLHALNAVLLWRVLRRLRVPAAWLAAAIFAVHPIQVESVAWITERKNVLSGFFALSALLAFLRATAIDRPTEPGSIHWRTYTVACVLFAAALSSKTTTCALPVVLLLLAWWKRGTIEPRVAWVTAPVFALGILMAVTTVAVERRYVQGGEWTRSFAERLLVAGRSFWFYPHTLIWPRSLAFIYPRWSIDAHVWWQYLFPAAAILMIIGLSRAQRRIGRGPVVAALCYAALLAPVSGFFNLYFMRYSLAADRFAYLPSVPLIALGTAVGAALMMRSGQAGRAIGAVTGGALLCILAWLAFRQSGLYETPRTLWADTVAKNPQSWLARNNLGVQLASDGEPDAALEQYNLAARLEPANAETYLNIANVLKAKGKLDEAAALYATALKVGGEYPMAHYNLGLTLAQQGKLDDAIGELSEAVRESPDYVEAHHSLGAAFQAQGDFERALAEYQTAARLRPGSPEALNSLASLFAAQGKIEDAVAYYDEVLHLHPDDVNAHIDLGNLLRAHGAPDQAAAQYAAALALQPTNAEAHNSLGVALAQEGRIAEATAHFEQAVRAKPDYPEAHSNLGNALQARGALSEAMLQYESALQLRPAYAEARNNLGMALSAQGRTEEAVAQFEQAVQASPDLAQARRNLADALIATHRYPEAAEQFEFLLRLHPADTEVRQQLDAVRSAQRGQLGR